MEVRRHTCAVSPSQVQMFCGQFSHQIVHLMIGPSGTPNDTRSLKKARTLHLMSSQLNRSQWPILYSGNDSAWVTVWYECDSSDHNTGIIRKSNLRTMSLNNQRLGVNVPEKVIGGLNWALCWQDIKIAYWKFVNILTHNTNKGFMLWTLTYNIVDF